jgi:hypothetical protein
MQQLKAIGQAIVSLIRQVWCLPHSIAIAAKERQRQIILDDLEAERLDRLRNPWKYLGK